MGCLETGFRLTRLDVYVLDGVWSFGPLLPAPGCIFLQRLLKLWRDLLIQVLGDGGGCDASEVHWAQNSVNFFTERAHDQNRVIVYGYNSRRLPFREGKVRA